MIGAVALCGCLEDNESISEVFINSVVAYLKLSIPSFLIDIYCVIPGVDEDTVSMIYAIVAENKVVYSIHSDVVDKNGVYPLVCDVQGVGKVFHALDSLRASYGAQYEQK